MFSCNLKIPFLLTFFSLSHSLTLSLSRAHTNRSEKNFPNVNYECVNLDSFLNLVLWCIIISRVIIVMRYRLFYTLILVFSIAVSILCIILDGVNGSEPWPNSGTTATAACRWSESIQGNVLSMFYYFRLTSVCMWSQELDWFDACTCTSVTCTYLYV